MTEREKMDMKDGRKQRRAITTEELIEVGQLLPKDTRNGLIQEALSSNNLTISQRAILERMFQE